MKGNNLDSHGNKSRTQTNHTDKEEQWPQIETAVSSRPENLLIAMQTKTSHICRGVCNCETVTSGLQKECSLIRP